MGSRHSLYVTVMRRWRAFCHELVRHPRSSLSPFSLHSLPGLLSPLSVSLSLRLTLTPLTLFIYLSLYLSLSLSISLSLFLSLSLHSHSPSLSLSHSLSLSLSLTVPLSVLFFYTQMRERDVRCLFR
jgi:hypothetical protein